MDEEVLEQESLEVNQDTAPVEEEQPDAGTPDDTPEYYLNENGKLVWKEAEEAVDTPEEDSDSEEEIPEEDEQPTEDDTTETEETELPTYKVKINGEEQEVPLDEILAGYMRQQDYTRKTQELAEQRKAIAQPAVPQNPVPTPQQSGNLNEIAKQIASKQLGLESPDELSELNFDHITAVVEAKQALLNQQNAVAGRQNAILGMEQELRAEDPAYDDILAKSQGVIENLPHKEFVKLQRAYENGDTSYLRDFYHEQRKAYYAEKVKSSVVPKKAVPKVEPSNQTPQPKTTKKIDFRQIGGMSSEQKAQMLIDMGLV